MMGYWNYYPPYVPVAEKKAKAARKLAQLQKKNPDIQPVLIEGNAIARTWWGRAWNQNLERYADYDNRIGRGRGYVRNGMVLDLRIAPGRVDALVQGTRATPYKIAIIINPLDRSTWKKVIRDCEGKFDSLSKLLEGEFPKELGEVLTAPGRGLFPTPKEINFSCTCPDWAYMCKHVAAALYGIGARLDQDPLLFFKLRKVDVNELVGRAVTEKARSMLKRAERKSGRVMDGADLGDLFGIDLEDSMEFDQALGNSSKAGGPGTKPKQTSRQKKNAGGAKPPAGSTSRMKKSVEKVLFLSKNASGKPLAGPQNHRSIKPLTAIDTIEGLIRKSRKGVSPATLAKKTGFDDKKVYNVLYRLRSLGRIRPVGTGKNIRYRPAGL